MGSRQRRKQRSEGGERKPPAPPRVAAPPSDAAAETRSEARNRAVREGLAPLAPGERPWPLIVATVLALGSALANVVFAVTSADRAREAIGPATFSILLLVTAVGLWRGRYWGLLGMQALLGLSILSIALFVFAAATGWQIAAWGTLLIALGYLFWKLVKLMARIQMPERG